MSRRSLGLGLVLLIMAVALGLRLWGLPRPPAGPYYDEAANGILAAGIADEGYRPLFIASYTGKEVLFFYLAAATIKLAGPGLLALRLTSALIGAATVLALYWCARELYPRGRFLALLAAALLAASFWHLALSRIGLRAVSEPLLQALTVAALWRGLRTGRRVIVILAGALLGLTAYTYLAARLFPLPLALALVAWLLSGRIPWRPRLGRLGLFGLAAAVAFAPLGVYFLRHPDRFLVRIEQVTAQGHQLTPLQAYARALGLLFVKGDPLARLNLPGKPVFGPLLAAAFLGGLVLLVRGLLRDREPLDRARDLLLLSWVPIMVLPTALTLSDVVPSHLRAAGLLPLLYLFPALSISWLLDRVIRWRPRSSPWLPAVALFAVLVPTAGFAARDYFGRLATRMDHYEISDGDVADLAAWLNTVDPADTPVYVASIHYRHPTVALLAQDYGAIKWLTGGRTLVAPAAGTGLLLVPRFIDYAWARPFLPAGSAVTQGLPLSPDGLPAFQAYRIQSDAALPVNGDASADFAHVIEIDGYQVLEAPAADGALDVVLRWRILNPPPRQDYQIFAHLVDRWDLPWGQAVPFQYPSSQWTPGERFLERVRIPLPAGTPSGEYQLRVGFYSPAEQTNLTIVDPDGRFGGIAATLPVSLARPAAPPGLPEPRQRLDVELAPGLTLVGADLDTKAARTLEPVIATLYWQAAAPLPDLTVRLRLGDLVLYEGAPVHGTYPTTGWRPGETVVDRYNPRIPLSAPAGTWPLLVEVTGPDAVVRSAELGMIEVTVPERTFSPPPLGHALNQPLGDAVELLGYDLGPAEGPALDLVLAWRATASLAANYTVYAHILGPDGALLGQVDSEPRGGAYPTSIWAPGEVITDSLHIPLSSLPAGLSLRVGLYQLETGGSLGEVLVDLPG
jgi:4-amino-4-deoxy-L-arabinose transferase-like glycosyltransferase